MNLLNNYARPFRSIRFGFTILELVVAVAFVGIFLFGVVVVMAVLSEKPIPRQMQSSTKVRGIHQSMALFAQSNNGYFPGLTGDGMVSDQGKANSPFLPSLNGASVEHRFAFLVDIDFFEGEYLISPVEEKVEWKCDTEPVMADNYSYALLRIHSDATKVGTALVNVEPDQGERTNVWRSELDSATVMLGDRSMQDSNGLLYSIHAREPRHGAARDWRGTVGWADNHVGFETSHELDTQYGSAFGIENDHLFRADQGNASFVEPSEGPWDEVMNNANAVLDAVGSSDGVEATRMMGE